MTMKRDAQYLKIHDTTLLSKVADFRRIEIVNIVSVSLTDLAPLARLEWVTALHLYSAIVDDFSAISNLNGLRSLTIEHTNLRTLDFLERMELQHLTLRGVPIEQHWLERAPDLVKYRASLPDEVDLRLTRALFDRGYEAAYDSRRQALKLLGHPKKYGASGFRILPEWLEQELAKPDFTMEALVERRFEFEDRIWEIEEAAYETEEARRGPRPSMESFKFGAYTEHGDSEAALTWVAKSALPKKDKERLVRFVRRFRELQFFRFTPDVFEPLEKALLISFPKHIQDQLTTLVLPLGHLEFYFKASRRRNSPRDAEFSRMRWWMHPRGEVDSNLREPGHHETGHFVIGHCPSAQYDMSLCHAPNLGGREVRWYYPGEPLRPFDQCQQLFDNYADMLGNVREIFDRKTNKTIKPKKPLPP